MKPSPISLKWETVLSGLLRLEQLEEVSLRSGVEDTTTPTRASLGLIVPNGFGGRGSVYLNLTPPLSPEGLRGFLHCVVTTLNDLSDSISASLNTVLDRQGGS